MFQNRWDCISARKILGESHTFFLNASCLAFQVKLKEIAKFCTYSGEKIQSFLISKKSLASKILRTIELQNNYAFFAEVIWEMFHGCSYMCLNVL